MVYLFRFNTNNKRHFLTYMLISVSNIYVIICVQLYNLTSESNFK